MSTLRELLSLTEAKKKFDHDACVKFVEGWCSTNLEDYLHIEEAEEQFWEDVDSDPERKAEAKRIGLTKAMAGDIIWQVADKMGLHNDHDNDDDPLDEAAPASNRMYGMDAPTDREKLISQIEGHTGTLDSMPYDKISTDDLKKILKALKASEAK